ncbi:hypothetical protein ACFY9Q_05630 [Streptomyces sp. NPDC012389]|uniref:hypothetical protein n=1 Tax=unclassified Streptomyces TaxID=2593676 RepID=UPI00136ED695|nr:hypothetical protein [Streptomyces sp. SID8374]MYX16752.1 hypothetical protein [Streptomyces sp. SID8374]
MDHHAEFIIVTLVGSLQRQTGERRIAVPALRSMRELAANDEPEIAIDHLVNTVNSYGLTLKREEYDRLSALAVRLDHLDVLADIRPELILP